MLIAGVGLEIGVIHAVGQRRVFYREHAVFIAGRYAEPVLSVVRGANLIVLPAFCKRRLTGVFKMHHAAGVYRALQAEVKPLGKVRGIIVVCPNIEADIGGVVQVFNYDGSAVKLAADFKHSAGPVKGCWESVYYRVEAACLSPDLKGRCIIFSV